MSTETTEVALIAVPDGPGERSVSTVKSSAGVVPMALLALSLAWPHAQHGGSDTAALRLSPGLTNVDFAQQNATGKSDIILYDAKTITRARLRGLKDVHFSTEGREARVAAALAALDHLHATFLIDRETARWVAESPELEEF